MSRWGDHEVFVLGNAARILAAAGSGSGETFEGAYNQALSWLNDSERALASSRRLAQRLVAAGLVVRR